MASLSARWPSWHPRGTHSRHQIPDEGGVLTRFSYFPLFFSGSGGDGDGIIVQAQGQLCAASRWLGVQGRGIPRVRCLLRAARARDGQPERVRQAGQAHFSLRGLASAGQALRELDALHPHRSDLLSLIRLSLFRFALRHPSARSS